MPNWSQNTVRVVGTKDKVDAFVANLRGETVGHRYAPRTAPEMRVIGLIEQGVPPLEADRVIGQDIRSLTGRYDRSFQLPGEPDFLPCRRPGGGYDPDLLDDWIARTKKEAAGGGPFADLEPKAPEPDHFCFNNLIPVPEEVFAASFHYAGYTYQAGVWGTKWEAGAPEPKITTRDDGLVEAVYEFQTAWAPPAPVFDAAAAAHPEVAIVAVFVEESPSYGYFFYTAGERVVAREVDDKEIPEDCLTKEVEDGETYFFVDDAAARAWLMTTAEQDARGRLGSLAAPGA